MGGLDVGGLFNKVTGLKPGSAEELGKGLAGAAGKILGDKAKPGIDEAGKKAADTVTEVAGEGISWLKVKGIQVVISTQYPDALPLDKSKGMTQFIENGLSALDLFKGKPDGKADAKTLDAINKLREGAGKEPLTGVDQFSKDDLKLLVDKLAEAKENKHAQNVLGNALDTLGGLKTDYPKPKAPSTTPGGPGMGNEGG